MTTMRSIAVDFLYVYLIELFCEFNSFTPVFLKWTLPSLNLGMPITAKRVSNTVDPDKLAQYEPSHLDQHCLHGYSRLSLP